MRANRAKVEASNGVTKMMVSIADLLRARDWLRSYDAGPGDTNEDMNRVADWIESEVDRRAKDHEIRKMARQAGVPLKIVRAVARRTGIGQNATIG